MSLLFCQMEFFSLLGDYLEIYFSFLVGFGVICFLTQVGLGSIVSS